MEGISLPERLVAFFILLSVFDVELAKNKNKIITLNYLNVYYFVSYLFVFLSRVIYREQKSPPSIRPRGKLV